MGKYFIAPEQLWTAIGGGEAPRIIDVRRRATFDGDDHMLPGAVWRDHGLATGLAPTLGGAADVVVYCIHGHQVSQSAAAALRAEGVEARVLHGGIEAWRECGLPTLRRSGVPGLSGLGGTRWVTRRRPKIDRVACPWLIKRFIDPEAIFLFVEPDQVLAVAEEIGAVSFDVDGGDITHQGELCSFEVLLALSGIDDPALSTLATIVRAADTDRLDLAPEAAGLLAMSIGVSALAGEDDRLACEKAFDLYDALYAWQRKAPRETHDWPATGAT